MAMYTITSLNFILVLVIILSQKPVLHRFFGQYFI